MSISYKNQITEAMLNLDFIYCTAVSYAMAQNNVPVVRRLTLDNSSDEHIEDIKVVISFVDSPFENFTTDVVVVPANSSLSVPNVILPLSAKYMAELTERVRDEIEVKVTSSKGEEIFSQSYPIEVLPFDPRIASRIDAHFTALFKRMVLKQTGDDKDLFFWREDQTPSENMNYRVGYSVVVKEILEEQISLLREDLVREVAHIFGYTRLGTIVLPSMERGIDKAIKRNFAKEDGDRIILI